MTMQMSTPPPRRRPWVARHKILTGIGAVLVVGAISSAVGGGGAKQAATSIPAAANDNGAVSSPVAAAPAPAPVATQEVVQAAPEPKRLLRVRGSGIHQTRSFTAAGDWDLGWAYDCTGFGYQGNFMIDVQAPGNGFTSNVGPNALGMKGHGVEHEHEGGTFYLTINSECDWSVIAVG